METNEKQAPKPAPLSEDELEKVSGAATELWRCQVCLFQSTSATAADAHQKANPTHMVYKVPQ